jgi:hypothetical protein
MVVERPMRALRTRTAAKEPVWLELRGLPQVVPSQDARNIEGQELCYPCVIQTQNLDLRDCDKYLILLGVGDGIEPTAPTLASHAGRYPCGLTPQSSNGVTPSLPRANPWSN